MLNRGHLGHGMQVMTKPFALEALAARVRRIIELSFRPDGELGIPLGS